MFSCPPLQPRMVSYSFHSREHCHQRVPKLTGFHERFVARNWGGRQLGSGRAPLAQPCRGHLNLVLAVYGAIYGGARGPPLSV